MLERIRSVLAVIEEGGVNRASRRLGISQPALSRQIQSLEQEIGAPLFERGSWGMRPTDLGFFVRNRFAKLIQEHDLAVAEAMAHAQGRHQQLRIGYLGLAAARFLNPALAILKNEFGEMKLLLFDQTPMEQLHALREGRLDIALVGEGDAGPTDDFYQRRAATLGVCAVLPADHAAVRGESVSLALLRNERFIGVAETAAPGRNRWMNTLCAKAGFKPRILAQTENVGETFTRIAAEGAVTLLPDYLTGPPPPGVACVRIAERWAVWHLSVLRQRGRGSPAARRLVELLVRAN